MKTEKSGNLFRMRALAAAIGFASGAVHAVDPVVTNLNDSGEGSLRQAILDASEDGGAPSLVTFQEGLSGTISLQSYLPTIFDAIDIQGEGITVRGLASSESEGGVFRIQSESSEQSFALRGLTITGSGTGGVSASLGYNNSSLLLQDVVITKNSGGAGVEARGGDLTVENSVISGNKKKFGPERRYGYGAGITFEHGELTLQDSKVIDNEAGSSGGGIYAYYASVNVERSVISGNTAGRRGGGILIRSYEGVELSISDSTISGNVANEGAGINAYGYGGGFLYIRNSSITDNRAVEDSSEEGGRAGGVRFATGSFNEGAFLLENSVVEGNSAESDGGLTINTDSVTIIASLIKNNVASDLHGGFRIDSSNLTISQSTITGNRAPRKAVGDIDPRGNYGSEFAIDSTTISGHSSDEDSALDISVGYSASVVITNSTISGNTARDAVVEIRGYSYNSPNLSILNSTFSGNRSTSAPSAIQLDNVDFQITHATFANNRAATSDDFATAAQLSIHNTESAGVTGILTSSVFTSGNDVEVQIGGNKFDFYEGFSSGGYVGASISNVIMTKNIAVDEGSVSEGTPLVVDAGLAPLGYRGGFTLVHEPMAGSAAIDAGSEGSRPDSRDQRGLVGNFGVGGNADLGAVEVVSNTAPRMVVNLGNQIDGVLGTEIPSFSVVDLFVDDEGDNVSVVDISGLPTGLSFSEGSIGGTLEVAGTFAVTAILTDDNIAPLQTVEQFVVTIPEKKKSKSGGGVPAGVLALFGFLAMLRRRRS